MKLRAISLGAGVQSTTMALMAAHGEIEPMPDCAIFADTQAEPQAVYDHLEWLMSDNVLPFPVHVVTAGNLQEHVAKKNSKGNIRVDIPAFAIEENGNSGPVNRSCTRDYKVTPIRKKVRELLGISGKRSPSEIICEQWIGISLDEIIRMKPSRESWQVNRWPLVEKQMTRGDCLEWMKRNDYPHPPKSSCIFCPYHSNEAWRSLTKHEFEKAVKIDRRLREHKPELYRARGKLYLHRSGIPLENVDFSTLEDQGQMNLFGNDCEGMCGV